MNTNKPYPLVITDVDLDGAGCIIVLKWLGLHFETKVTNDRQEIAQIVTRNTDREIYITDIDCSIIGEEIDKVNVTIFDHHSTHTFKYKNAKAYVREFSSCTRMMYDIFKVRLSEKLTTEQKILIRLVDDYDSYELKYPYSLALNNIFWQYTGNRCEKFVIDFHDGFKGFNREQCNMIKIHVNRVREIIDNLEIFSGKLRIGGVEYIIVSAAADFAINEISDHILNHTNGDISIIFNLKRGTVCLRKDDKCPVDLGKLAERIADGGGHMYSAGGKITKTIIDITKTLKQVK